MKRRDLLKELENMGCVLIRHGGKHDWYQNTKTKVSQPVPHHREINEVLLPISGRKPGKFSV
jgi:predicted RNA binding protein YcfA (HicA-like mRNA interferase family)